MPRHLHPLRATRSLVRFIAVLLSLSTSPLHPQTAPSFTLEVLPETLELQSCDVKTPLFVVARNTGAQSIASLTLTHAFDPKITLTPDPPDKPATPGQPRKPTPVLSLKKGDQRRWSYFVTCSSAFPPSNLIFTATARSSTKPSGLSQFVLKSIPIKLRLPDALDTIATVEIKSNLETLTQASLGDLLVAVTNKSTQPISVKVQPQHSSSITFSLPEALKSTGSKASSEEPEQSHTIDGGETFTFPYLVKASQRVAPGKQLLGVNVSIQNDKLHSFLVTKEVSVGVLGESEALKLLGVPSLLFLPGFLVMTSIGLLWRAGVSRPANEAASFDLSEKDPGYWVISIVLSAVILGGFLFFRPSFLSLYGLQDIALAWLVSIFLGAVVYLGWRRYMNRKARKNYPQADDSVERVLERLVTANKKMGLPQATLKNSGAVGFLLAMEPDDSIYLCPQVILTWYGNADEEFKNSIQTQLTTEGNPATVLQILKDSHPYASYGFNVDWNKQNQALMGPRKIARDAYTWLPATGVIITEIDAPAPGNVGTQPP